MSTKKLVNVVGICIFIVAAALFGLFTYYCSKYDTSIVPYVREVFHLH